MYQRRSAWPAAAVFPHPSWNGRLNASPAKLPPEISAVVTFVGTQAGRAFLGTPLWSGHSNSVHHLQPYSNLSHIGRRHQETQGQAIALSQQVDGASLAFPAIGDILSPSYLKLDFISQRSDE